MRYLLIISILILIGCAHNCCHGTELPQGQTCSDGSYKDCEGTGIYKGEQVYCKHYATCDAVVNLEQSEL